MRSKTTAVRIPFPLHEALESVCERRGFDHMHSCIIGACYLLVQVDRMLGRISNIANAKPKDQDLMLRVLIDFPVDQEGMVRELKRLDRSQ